MCSRAIRGRGTNRLVAVVVALLAGAAAVAAEVPSGADSGAPDGGAPSGGMVREQVAVVETGHGTIVWRFLADAAPGHVAYVKELIGRGFYDGTTFHRVIPHFVVQGGDPNSRLPDRKLHGEGEGDRRLKAEFSPTLHYRPGTVGMARDTDPDTGSCQFFIALADLPRLDGRYTIFGEVVEGLEVAQRIAQLPRDLADNPLAAVPVRVRLETREVPAGVRSSRAGADGELLTGPGKPLFYDPLDPQWTAPELLDRPAAAAAVRECLWCDRSIEEKGAEARAKQPGPVRIELALDERGTVIDMRLPALETPNAAALKDAVARWRFVPARLAGKPVKVRFEIGADGDGIRRSPAAPPRS